VPSDKYWGASTERSNKFFDIGKILVNISIIKSIAIIKRSAAVVHEKEKQIEKKIAKSIIKASEEVIKGKMDENFPLKVWQTGSGTQTNMNVNEVIANRAIEILGGKKGSKKPVHPNDHVNKSQSTNDVFPTAMHMAIAIRAIGKLIPSINLLNLQLKKKSTKDQNVVLKEAKSILKSIMDQINEDMRPRLNEVKQIVGFRQDMWDAAQVVINSAERRVFVLTSFSNKKFLGDVADMLAEASERSSPEILLSFGEPDRGRSPEDIEKTNRYISTLSKDKRLNLKGGVSAIPTHSKIIVSDTGMIFLCSCNLFSGSFDSGVLESGLLIKDEIGRAHV
jgi:hypothetical protein